jgi:pimeloyl-ACP methyl ester carboxylesterase
MELAFGHNVSRAGAGLARCVAVTMAAGLVVAGSSAGAARRADQVVPRTGWSPTPASVLLQPIRHTKVNGAVIGYRSGGAGRPLVLIAGSSNTMAEWDPALLDSLAAHRRVIIFDNRGVGTSTGPVGHLTIGMMAHDTQRLIATVARGRADVLGWSMGGYVAQKLAIKYPQRVRRLILASTDCGGPRTLRPKPWALRILTDPDATIQQRLTVLFPADQMAVGQAWLTAISSAFAANHFQPADSFTVSLAAARAQTQAAGQRWLRAGGGTCHALGRITQRVLIGAGRSDVVVPIRNAKRLLIGIPKAQRVRYEDAGHAFLFQPALGFVAAADRFLAAGE